MQKCSDRTVRRFLLIGLFSCGALIPVVGRAEPLTLQEAYRLALQHEQVRIAEEGVVQSRQEWNRALSFALPNVTVEANYTRAPEETADLGGADSVIQPEWQSDVTVRLKQPVYSGGRLKTGLRIARRLEGLSEEDLALGREALLFETAQAYYEVLKSQRLVEVRDKELERLREHLRQAEGRFRVGEVTKAVLLRAEAELNRAEAERIAAKNALIVARDRLLYLIGGSSDRDSDRVLAEPALPTIPLGLETALQQQADEHREDLKRARIERELAREEIALARTGFYPELSLEADYFWRDQDEASPFFIDESWSVSAKLEYPFFEGGLNRAELNQARSRLRQSELRLRDLEKTTRTEIHKASLTLQATAALLTARQKQAEFARENFEIVEKQFNAGLVTNVDLLDADQLLRSAEQDLIAATYDHHLAILGLQKGVGLFLKETAVPK
jgi:outer membrane protein